MTSDVLAIFRGLTADLRRTIDGPAHTRQRMDAAEAEAALSAWLDLAVPQVRAILAATWDDQRGALTAEAVAAALAAGDLTGDVLERWRQAYSAAVTDQLGPLWLQGAGRASTHVGGALGFGVPAEAFAAKMDAWAAEHGGELIVYLTDQQREAVRYVLRRAAGEGLAPKTVAAQLKPIVGLTPRQARALEAYRSELVLDPDVPAASIEGLVGKRAKQLHDVRATRIARTELADGYNEASLQTVRVAVEEEVIDESPKKVWLTGEDERVCSVCGPLHETTAKLNGTFDGGHDRPTAHPGCRCTLVYEFKE